MLKAGGAAALATSTASCDLLSTEPSTGRNAGGDAEDARRKAKEAPELVRKVQAGELPPLKQRLPVEPMELAPLERLGDYGGTWRTAVTGPGSLWVYYTIGYENLVRWTPDWTGAAGLREMLPNVAKGFDISPDGREVTFVLRKGMRWSDGEPFSAHDIAFAQNDVLNNKSIYPTLDPNTPTAVVVDDETVRLVFPQPDALFLRRQCSPVGAELTTKPKHYLEKYHEKYNKDAQALAKEAGLGEWTDLFAAKADWQGNTELPTLNPWIIVRTADSGQLDAERNPYFWKTDTDGRQLPYIDKVTYDVLNDSEVILTRALNGEIDMHVRDFNTFTNKPVLAKYRERGDFRFFEAVRTTANNMDIGVNLTHNDPVKREIFRNKNFRLALSYAFDRAEIVDAALQRQGAPWQQAPGRESAFYDRKMAKQYTRHRTRRAKQLLDQAGFSERNSDGVRLGPDGAPISFAVEFPTDFDPSWPNIVDMVVQAWRGVGLDVSSKPVSRELYSEHVQANSHDAGVWRGNGGLDILLVPDGYFPRSDGPGCFFAPLWGRWYVTRGAEGEEPPEPAKRQMQVYDEIRSSMDETRQAELVEEMLAIAQEEVWVLGTALSAQQYGIVKKDFRNVPSSMPYGSTYPTPGPTNPEQYFIARDAG